METTGRVPSPGGQARFGPAEPAGRPSAGFAEDCPAGPKAGGAHLPARGSPCGSRGRRHRNTGRDPVRAGDRPAAREAFELTRVDQARDRAPEPDSAITTLRSVRCPPPGRGERDTRRSAKRSRGGPRRRREPVPADPARARACRKVEPERYLKGQTGTLSVIHSRRLRRSLGGSWTNRGLADESMTRR